MRSVSIPAAEREAATGDTAGAVEEAAPGTDALIRRAARMASRLKADLDVVHVAASDATRPADRPTRSASTSTSSHCAQQHRASRLSR
jgi:K+-sensing histidine kinase KdpD